MKSTLHIIEYNKGTLECYSSEERFLSRVHILISKGIVIQVFQRDVDIIF